MVPDVIFLVKLNTGHQVLFDGSRSNFQSEIQQVWKFLSSPYVLWQVYQIVDIEVSLDSLLKIKYENIA